MKPYEADFVNPFGNIYLTFCFFSGEVVGLTEIPGDQPPILRTSVCLGARGEIRPHQQNRAAG
jgi:hypothetical protein